MALASAVNSKLQAGPLAGFLHLSEMVRIERRTLALEIQSSGRLVPWLGPAIRGVSALRYRATVCQQPRETWADRWKHCRGCPHLSTCGYGIAFEPEASAGHTDAVRPLIMAPAFPVAVDARPGQLLPVQITSVGAEATATVPAIIDALADAGRRDGLGPDRVRFAIADTQPPAESIVVDPRRLPALDTPSGLVPRLTIRLETPLFLRQRESQTRRMILDPDFATLVRRAARIVREFFPGLAADFDPDALTAVPTASSALAPFRQEKASRRTFRRFELEGIVGSITFADAPASALPWLVLAGILHVGGHRVAGAGAWTVHTEPSAMAIGRQTR